MNLGDVFTETGLRLNPSLSWEEWAALGPQVGAVYRTSPWAVADWLLLGEDLYGEKSAQALESTGLAFHTLQNLASLGRRIRPEIRRPELGLSHHQLVSKFEPPQQRIWLEKAVTNNWTRSEMVTELITAGIRDPRKPSGAWDERTRTKVRVAIERQLVRWRMDSEVLPPPGSALHEALRREHEVFAVALMEAIEKAVTEK